MRYSQSAWEWRTSIAEFDEWQRTVKGAPSTTRRTRREHLALFGRTIRVGPWEATDEDVQEWFDGRAWAPNTYRSRRTTLRAFYSWAVLAGKVDRSPAHLVQPGPVPVPRPRPVPDRHYATALSMATPRERLICRLAGEHGLRRAEVAVIRPAVDVVEDLDGWSLIVHGKGGRERLVPLLDDVAVQLRGLGGDNPGGWAFPGNRDGHLSPEWIGRLLARLLPEDYTMHKLRHRAGTRVHEASGGDLALTQDFLGHADPKTTRVYVQVNARRLREAVGSAASSS